MRTNCSAHRLSPSQSKTPRLPSSAIWEITQGKMFITQNNSLLSKEQYRDISANVTFCKGHARRCLRVCDGHGTQGTRSIRWWHGVCLKLRFCFFFFSCQATCLLRCSFPLRLCSYAGCLFALIQTMYRLTEVKIFCAILILIFSPYGPLFLSTFFYLWTYMFCPNS